MTKIGPFGYSGGWNAKCGPYDLPQDSYLDAQNVDIQNGRIVAKTGNTEWTTDDINSSGNMEGLTYFQGYLVGAGGAKVKTASSTAAGAWTDITGATTFSTNTSTWMESLNNILIIGNSGLTVPVQWNGTGNIAAVTGSPPAAGACAAMVNNYLFIGNITSYPWRVQWSSILDPNSWPAANYVNVRVNDNEPIQALCAFGEDLLIFKKTSIHRLYTNQLSAALGPLVCVNEKLGCSGEGCVDRLPDGRIAFVGIDNHIYVYDGNTFDDISNPPYPRSNIQPVLDRIPFRSLAYQCLRVFKSKSQIWISAPIADYTNSLGNVYQNGFTLIYDYSLGVWVSAYVDTGIHKMVNYYAASPLNLEMFVSAEYRKLYREDNGYVLNSSLAASTSMKSFVSKSVYLDPDSRKFHPASMYIPILSGSFIGSFYYGANGYEAPSSSTNIVVGAARQERKKVVYLSSPYSAWNTVQYRFQSALSNQSFVLSPCFISDERLEQV